MYLMPPSRCARCSVFGLDCRNLYASEANQTYVSLLLEMFSNIIQYQYVGNAHLVYAIVRRQEVRGVYVDTLGVYVDTVRSLRRYRTCRLPPRRCR